ncbi:MAG TPA: FkbM family methyltransferase, partial [Myxococcales bacterium]|nr:FkbM family methyltransferase [Myxococcales bacterium]
MNWRTTIRRALRVIKRDPRRAFLSQWVEPNSIVFDVGAHRGELSEVFQSCGATIVAVEPQRACHGTLK